MRKSEEQCAAAEVEMSYLRQIREARTVEQAATLVRALACVEAARQLSFSPDERLSLAVFGDRIAREVEKLATIQEVRQYLTSQGYP